MSDAIRQHVASLLAHGAPGPQNERLVPVEELSIELPWWPALPQVSARELLANDPVEIQKNRTVHGIADPGPMRHL